MISDQTYNIVIK